MIYAKVKNEVVEKYPYTVDDFYEDNKYTQYYLPPDFFAQFPETDMAKRDGFSLVEVTQTQKPDYNPLAQIIVEGVPSQIDGVWTQIWEVREGTPQELDEARADRINKEKLKRADAINSIVVTTTSGNVFDGDEESQGRMAMTIVGMSDSDRRPWVMANNTIVMCDKSELQEALRLSGLEMARIWVFPYTQ